MIYKRRNKMENKTQTIEKTSKNLKLQAILSVLLFIFSFMFCCFTMAVQTSICGNDTNCSFANVGAGVGIIMLGLIGLSVLWFVITQIRIYWNHG